MYESINKYIRWKNRKQLIECIKTTQLPKRDKIKTLSRLATTEIEGKR